MSMDEEQPPLEPELERARYTAMRQGDRFVGLWLALVMEARQRRSRSVARQARRILERFWAGRDVQIALHTVGIESFNNQLRDAAHAYFMTCLDDRQYSSTMWRTSRVEPEKLREKMARDTANTLALLADSGGLVGVATHLPALLTDGFLKAVSPQGAEELAEAVARIPAAVRALEIAEVHDGGRGGQ